MDDIDLLMELGMTKTEAKVYLTLLRHGPLTAGRIVTLSKQFTSVTYYAIQRLVEKGFISHVRKGRFDEYFAISPEIFREKLKAIMENLDEKLPAWKNLAELAERKTTVEVFEGMKGLANIVNQMFKTAKKGDKWRSFTLGKENEKPEVLDFWKKVNEKRLKLGLNIRAICNIAYKEIMYKYGDPKHLKTANLRFVNFEFPQGIVILNDHVLFIFWEDEPITIHIKNSRMAAEYGKFFDKLYENGEPYKPPK